MRFSNLHTWRKASEKNNIQAPVKTELYSLRALKACYGTLFLAGDPVSGFSLSLYLEEFGQPIDEPFLL